MSLALNRLAQRLLRLEKEVAASRTPQLAYSSVTADDGTEIGVVEGLTTAMSASAGLAGALDRLDTAEARLDGVVETYFQEAEPTGATEGDLWFRDSDNRLHRLTGGVWVEIVDADIVAAIDAAQNAQTTADGKISAYWQGSAPTAASEGDLWYDTSNGNVVKRLTSGVWQPLLLGTGAIADDAITSDKIGDLTTPPTVQGDPLVTDAQLAAVDQAASDAAAAAAEADGKAVAAQGAASSAASAASAAQSTASAVAALTDGWKAADSVSIDGGAIFAGSITAASGAIADLDASKITVGKITAAQMEAGTITAASGVIGSIDAAKITVGKITASQLQAGTITAASGVIGSIDASKITVGQITGAQIAADAIDGKVINGVEINGATITGGVIQTAASGARWELSTLSSSNYLSGFTGSTAENPADPPGIGTFWDSDIRHTFGIVVQSPMRLDGVDGAYLRVSTRDYDSLPPQEYGGPKPGGGEIYAYSSDKIEMKSDGQILLNPAGSLTIGGSAGIFAPQQSASFKKVAKGTGQAQGSNYGEVTRTTTYTAATGVWTTVSYNTWSGTAVADDGSMYTSSTFRSNVDGMFTLTASATFQGNTTGYRAIRIITEGGTVLAREGFVAADTPFRDIHVSATFRLPGGGYGVRVEIFHSAGTTLTMPAHLTDAPVQARFSQVA